MCKIYTNTRRIYHRFSACFPFINEKTGTNIMAIIFVPGCFTLVYQRWWPLYLFWVSFLSSQKSEQIKKISELLYFHFLHSPEQIYEPVCLFLIALLPFQNSGTIIMTIILVPGCFPFIYQRAWNKYYIILSTFTISILLMYMLS